MLRWNEIEHLRQLEAERKVQMFGDVTIIERNTGFGWMYATPYNYGMGAPRYPVPALLTETWVTESGEIFIVSVD